MSVTAGKLAASVLVLSGIAAGVGVWYTQEYLYYDELPPISELAAVDASGAPMTLAVRDFQGIDGTSSPIKWRGCMTVDPVQAGHLAPFKGATPLNPPNWFDCFDPGQLTDDIAAGRATARLVQPEIRPDVDRVIAVYSDGRAFGWQQINDKTPERGVMD